MKSSANAVYKPLERGKKQVPTGVVLTRLAGYLLACAKICLIVYELELLKGYTIYEQIYISCGGVGGLVLLTLLVPWRAIASHKSIKAIQVDRKNRKVNLLQGKKKKHLKLETISASLYQEGYFVGVGLWAHKSEKKLLHLTNAHEEWDRDDLLNLAQELKSTGMEFKQKTTKVGIKSGKKIIFKNDFSQPFGVLLALVLVGIVPGIMYPEVVQAYLEEIVLVGVAILFVLLISQKQFVITPKKLILKNLLIPVTRYSVDIAQIASIELTKGPHSHIVLKTAHKTKKLTGNMKARDLQQVVFFVQENAKMLAEV